MQKGVLRKISSYSAIPLALGHPPRAQWLCYPPLQLLFRLHVLDQCPFAVTFRRHQSIANYTTLLTFFGRSRCFPQLHESQILSFQQFALGRWGRYLRLMEIYPA